MKKCSKCGQELDESEFNRHAKAKDGLQPYCKQCQRVTYKAYRDRVQRYTKCVRGGESKTNPELASFTPRQLMEELKTRGYTGELKYVQTIKL